jgi:predicted metal-dependent phosphoesterase TrpH
MAQVFFKRPKYIPNGIFKMLKSVGFQAADLHFHSEYGMDSVSRIVDVLKKCKRKGIGVAITDHNDIAGAEKAWKMRKDVFVIPGMEASTNRGVHSLYYFSSMRDCRAFFNKVVKKLRKKNPFFLPINIEELMEKAQGYNAYISVSHPYGPGVIGVKKVKFKKMRMKKLERKFDFVEGLTAANLRGMNEKAIKWARFVDKPMTAGSDGHTTAELGSVLTLSYGNDIDEYFHSIKKEKNVLLGKEQNLFLDAINQVVKERKYFKEAREMGKGMFWVKEHKRELEKLREGLHKVGKHIRHPYQYYHHASEKHRVEIHKEYVKLGKGLFR